MYREANFLDQLVAVLRLLKTSDKLLVCHVPLHIVVRHAVKLTGAHLWVRASVAHFVYFQFVRLLGREESVRYHGVVRRARWDTSKWVR